jgi:hypothetical protein
MYWELDGEFVTVSWSLRCLVVVASLIPRT